MSSGSNFIVRGGLDMSNLTQGLRRTQTQLSNFQTTTNATMSKVGSAIKIALAYISVRAIAGFGKSCIDLASDLQEVQNVVDVTFGSMSKEINDWSKTALTQFGLSELSAKKYASTMGAMLKSSGISGTAMKDMAKGIAELTADMASFYNLDSEEAFAKIRSGLSGETEPLKQLGINMSVANIQAYALSQGIKKSYSAMTQAEQTVLRYNYLMSVTSDAQGDFARTSGSWANQTRLLSEQWRSFQATLGSAFISLLTPVLQVLNNLISKLQIAAQYFKAFVELITGVDSSAQSSSGAVVDLGESATDTGNAVKKANKTIKGSLAGFDQLNTLSQNASSALDDIAGSANIGNISTASPTVDTSGVDKFKGKMDELKVKVSEVWASLQKAFGAPLQKLFGTVSSVGSTVFTGLKDSALTVSTDMANNLRPIVQWFIDKGFPMLCTVTGDVVKAFGQLFTAGKSAFDTLWADVINPFLKMYSANTVTALNEVYSFWENNRLKILGVINTLFTGIKTGWSNFWAQFKPVFDQALSEFDSEWTVEFKDLLKELKIFFTNVVSYVSYFTKNFVAPIVSALQKVFTPAFVTAFEAVSKIVVTALTLITKAATSIIKALNSITTFMKGVFTGDWSMAWTGLTGIVNLAIEGFKFGWKSAINIVIGYFNWMIGKVNDLYSVKTPDWLPGGFGGKTLGLGVQIPKLPYLAKGGITNGEMIATIGDNPGGREVVSPLDDLIGMISNAVKGAMNSNNSGAPSTVILKVGETELGRATINAINNVQRQAGTTLLII